jgi:serine/threonine protein kinase
MAGTVPYTAPEQLQGKPRKASDQYSLGIVAYECSVLKKSSGKLIRKRKGSMFLKGEAGARNEETETTCKEDGLNHQKEGHTSPLLGKVGVPSLAF